MDNNQLGGQADFNGITVYDNQKRVTVIRNDDGSLFIKVKEQSKKKFDLLTRILLIRGFIQFLNTMFTQLNNYKIVESTKTKKQFSLQIIKFYKFIYESSAIIGFLLIFTLTPALLQFLPWFDNKKLLLLFSEGATRIIIYFILLELISKLNNIAHLLKYHAAEHMAINSFEKNKNLTVPAIRRSFQKNIRCGSTYFFILAMIYAIIFIIMYFINVPLTTNIFLRIIALPICCGLTHEVINIIDRYKGNISKNILSLCMTMQTKTLLQPDDHHLQVAVVAINIHHSDTTEGYYNLSNFFDINNITKLS
jgi:uncharacterized protein YqhQ